jgi:hypothetical protein
MLQELKVESTRSQVRESIRRSVVAEWEAMQHDKATHD